MTKLSVFDHTCGDGGSLYKNESELFFFPLSNKAERLCDCHHTSSFLLFFPSLLHYTGVCMQHCPSWVSQSPTGVSQSTHTYEHFGTTHLPRWLFYLETIYYTLSNTVCWNKSNMEKQLKRSPNSWGGKGQKLSISHESRIKEYFRHPSARCSSCSALQLPPWRQQLAKVSFMGMLVSY